MRRIVFNAETQRRKGFLGMSRLKTIVSSVSFLSLCLCVSVANLLAQIPEPGPAKSVNIPAVKETRLKNGLTVAVVEKKGVPIVTVQLLVKAGASSEGMEKAGLANLTASMLTKGTKTRTAVQIAEEMEFLGGSIFSSAGWQNSSVGMSVTTDKFAQAMAILGDVALNPSFAESELELEKSQTLDELKYNLTQAGFLANYLASSYSFKEHPTGGTPTSIGSMTRGDVAGFYDRNYFPERSVLIFVGEISNSDAVAAAEKYFGKWTMSRGEGTGAGNGSGGTTVTRIVGRLLVIDMPDSGQAAVNYFKPVLGIGRNDKEYYPASVLNSLLGGGYSSRLNQEIRIKRGLSYGAGSNFGWRGWKTNFSARTQTKNESAAEVADLIVAELKRLADTDPTDAELGPRKSVLAGGFGRNLETTQGLAGALADLYSFGIPTTELNAFVANVNAVPNASIKTFASRNFVNGDLVIVGDYAKFKDDLAKRFPGMTVDVIKADELDITKPNLRK